MRGILSLVSLLVVVAIIAYLFSIYSIPAAKEGKKAQDQARQMSGRSEDNTPAERSVKLDGEPGGGPLKDLLVLEVTPGGAMDQYYGLQVGDKITAIGDSDVGAMSNNDFEMAKALLVQEGFEKKRPITVLRNGLNVQLPIAKGAGAPAAPQAGVNPADPGVDGAADQRRAMEKQLKQIKIPG